MFKFTFIKQTQSQGSSTDSHYRIRLQKCRVYKEGVCVCSVLTSHCLCPQRGDKGGFWILMSLKVISQGLSKHFSGWSSSGIKEAGHGDQESRFSWPWPDISILVIHNTAWVLKHTKDNLGTNGPGALQPLHCPLTHFISAENWELRYVTFLWNPTSPKLYGR